MIDDRERGADGEAHLEAPAASKKIARQHLYLTVLGSCATADSFRTAGWPSFVDEGIRVFDYVGRTGFSSLCTEGFADDEIAPRAVEVDSEWGFSMARGEVEKTHAKQLLRGAKTNQVLVFDVVTDFIFDELRTTDGRSFLASWELEKYYAITTDVRARPLWERPYEPYRDDAIRWLSRLRELRPDLRVGFHVAPACDNDGVRFKVEPLNDKVSFYYSFCERLAKDLEGNIPGLTILQAPRDTWSADPAHPYRRFPFHYRLPYYLAFRRLVKRWLDLPDEARVASSTPSA